MRLVTMGSAPIMQQLHLEERLLRRTSDNWCILNEGTAPPTIVMGVSGKVSELVEIQPVLRDGVQPFPRDIMTWTGQLYGKVFRGFGEFQLRENDYAFGHRKFGGNAQSITKDRWVHHTSFLWDYDAKSMNYLKNPQRAPEYRQARNHTDFLCRMNEYMPSRSGFTEGITTALKDHFTVQHTELETALSDDNDFVPSTKMLSPQDLQDIISSKESPTVERVQGWPQS
ncbi:hypothetical protein ACQ4PT_039678 [Festuca glaucescens]